MHNVSTRTPRDQKNKNKRKSEWKSPKRWRRAKPIVILLVWYDLSHSHFYFTYYYSFCRGYEINVGSSNHNLGHKPKNTNNLSKADCFIFSVVWQTSHATDKCEFDTQMLYIRRPWVYVRLNGTSQNHVHIQFTPKQRLSLSTVSMRRTISPGQVAATTRLESLEAWWALTNVNYDRNV